MVPPRPTRRLSAAALRRRRRLSAAAKAAAKVAKADAVDKKIKLRKKKKESTAALSIKTEQQLKKLEIKLRKDFGKSLQYHQAQTAATKIIGLINEGFNQNIAKYKALINKIKVKVNPNQSDKDRLAEYKRKMTHFI